MWREIYSSVLFSLSSGAPGSHADLLLAYSMIKLSVHNTITLIITIITSTTTTTQVLHGVGPVRLRAPERGEGATGEVQAYQR